MPASMLGGGDNKLDGAVTRRSAGLGRLTTLRDKRQRAATICRIPRKLANAYVTRPPAFKSTVPGLKHETVLTRTWKAAAPCPNDARALNIVGRPRADIGRAPLSSSSRFSLIRGRKRALKLEALATHVSVLLGGQLRVPDDLALPEPSDVTPAVVADRCGRLISAGNR